MPNKQDQRPDEATDREPRVPANADQLAHAVHELRNSMNTLLMNAAVLGTGARNVPESLRPFVEQIAKAGRRCNEDLTRLFEIVESRKG